MISDALPPVRTTCERVLRACEATECVPAPPIPVVSGTTHGIVSQGRNLDTCVMQCKGHQGMRQKANGGPS